jgi:hypothetical protein
MLNPVVDLPASVFGLKASGTVIAQDIAQAFLLAQAEPLRDGFLLFVDPDLDGYFAEIVSALDTASAAPSPAFRRWGLVLPDDMVSQADQYRTGGQVEIFPQSRRQEALEWATGASG